MQGNHQILISPELLAVARQKARDLGKLRKSITEGAGNIYGVLGELIFHQLFPDAKWVSSDPSKPSYEFDFVLPNGMTVDVKSKRLAAHVSEPTPDFCASVWANHVSKCDLFVFLRISMDMRRAWLCGWLPFDEYFMKAKYMEKGKTEGYNNWTVKDDCWNVPYGKLNEPLAWPTRLERLATRRTPPRLV